MVVVVVVCWGRSTPFLQAMQVRWKRRERREPGVALET